MLGHSLGGYVGGHFLKQFPDKVENLYLISPGGMNSTTEEHIQNVNQMVQSFPFYRRIIAQSQIDSIFVKKVENI